MYGLLLNVVLMVHVSTNYSFEANSNIERLTILLGVNFEGIEDGVSHNILDGFSFVVGKWFVAFLLLLENGFLMDVSIKWE